jgi:mannose-6-phosphate isomerase-like protein (cupin superfamily)
VIDTVSYPEPLYRGESGERSATIRRADAEPELRYPNGTRVHYLATGAKTHGLFGLYRWDFGPQQSGPEPHFHRSITETFFVLAGAVQVHDGTGWRDTTANDYFYVPEGGVHGFRNLEGEPASMLILFAPGAPREDYFETLAHLAENPMTDDERDAFMLRHDTFWL